MPESPPTICVVICAFDLARWGDLVAGVDAARQMLAEGDELVVVIDHNPRLLLKAQEELPGHVVPSAGPQGISGARNTGVAIATADVVVFLDDDAVPQPGWLQAYRERFADPAVALVGGAIEANWDGGQPPGWFPAEFGWVVGCDYRGLPGHGGTIRNPIGANMAVRRIALQRIGGFSSRVGRVGNHPSGAEETEFAIRVRQAEPGALIVRDARTRVLHRVPASRRSVYYFVRRCYHEGGSKAALSRAVGVGDALRTEWPYVLHDLSGGIARNIASALKGDLNGLARMVMLLVGFGATAFGYLQGRARSMRLPGGYHAPMSGHMG